MLRSISCVLGTVAALLLAAIGTRYVTPHPYFSPFHNGQIHLALAATALAALGFALQRSRFLLAVIVAGLAMAAHQPIRVHRFGDMASPAEAAGKPALRVLSFNILYDNVPSGPTIGDAILRSGADVAVVLEAVPLHSQLERLSAVYPYRLGCGEGTPLCDLVVFSKRPFLGKAMDVLSDVRAVPRYMRITIDVGGKPVNVVATHLSKPYFDEAHTLELARLRGNLSKVEGPVVLAGDFNAASIAPDMMWFLGASGMKKAPFEPSTWPVRLGPFGIAIDHVYARPPMRLARLERIADNHGSNHYGLIADLVIDE